MKRKVFAGVMASTAALILALSGCGAQKGASDAGGGSTSGSATEQSAASNASVTKKTVAVYDGDESKKQDFECLFREDMPNVPYVDVEKYLELVFNDTDFVVTQSGDQFTYHGEIGDKKGSNFVVDTAKDTASFEKPKSFLVGKQNDMDSDYIKIEPEEVEAEKELLYKLADYGIDLLAEGGKAYMPVSTISDINFQSYSWPDYVDGSIYLARFGSSSSSEFIAEKEGKIPSCSALRLCLPANRSNWAFVCSNPGSEAFLGRTLPDRAPSRPSPACPRAGSSSPRTGRASRRSSTCRSRCGRRGTGGGGSTAC